VTEHVLHLKKYILILQHRGFEPPAKFGQSSLPLSGFTGTCWEWMNEKWSGDLEASPEFKSLSRGLEDQMGSNGCRK
jgi:hypothetical protein